MVMNDIRGLLFLVVVERDFFRRRDCMGCRILCVGLKMVFREGFVMGMVMLGYGFVMFDSVW